ncbi:MAG: hypothetical protein AEth_00325 [Candidatus Argoarchaeum ethanivorans]|uniref:Uncharacterized protein n=1 Tax=Candidatus Argoarchaeum ethanivorans TaxID=2608793 RepID=A0A8B3S538_9EURY|nr:MAG: hypothetical protein AEth_00325 [Candidatus Argoarchaeum ethanivorans]
MQEKLKQYHWRMELGAKTLIANDRAVIRFVRSIPSLFKSNVIGTGDVLDIALDRGNNFSK